MISAEVAKERKGTVNDVSSLAEHPGCTFSCAGEGYRLYVGGVFAGWFGSFSEMVGAL